MKIKLEPWATMPTKAHPDDAGWDLYSPIEAWLVRGCSITIPTGVHVQLPQNVGGIIADRSSMYKQKIMTSGLIDPGYTGEIGVTLINVGLGDYYVHKGDRIAQLVIVPVVSDGWELTDELDESARGNGGFGSSGK